MRNGVVCYCVLALCIVARVQIDYVHIFAYSFCSAELLSATDLGILGFQKWGFLCAPVIAV